MNDVNITPTLLWDTFINLPWYYYLIPILAFSIMMIKIFFETVKRNNNDGELETKHLQDELEKKANEIPSLLSEIQSLKLQLEQKGKALDEIIHYIETYPVPVHGYAWHNTINMILRKHGLVNNE